MTKSALPNPTWFSAEVCDAVVSSFVSQVGRQLRCAEGVDAEPGGAAALLLPLPHLGSAAYLFAPGHALPPPQPPGEARAFDVD